MVRCSFVRGARRSTTRPRRWCGCWRATRCSRPGACEVAALPVVVVRPCLACCTIFGSALQQSPFGNYCNGVSPRHPHLLHANTSGLRAPLPVRRRGRGWLWLWQPFRLLSMFGVWGSAQPSPALPHIGAFCLMVPAVGLLHTFGLLFHPFVLLIWHPHLGDRCAAHFSTMCQAPSGPPLTVVAAGCHVSLNVLSPSLLY